MVLLNLVGPPVRLRPWMKVALQRRKNSPHSILLWLALRLPLQPAGTTAVAAPVVVSGTCCVMSLGEALEWTGAWEMTAVVWTTASEAYRRVMRFSPIGICQLLPVRPGLITLTTYPDTLL